MCVSAFLSNLYRVLALSVVCLCMSVMFWICEQRNASCFDYKISRPTGSVSVLGELSLVRGIGTLTVKWVGAKTTDLILISIDSKEAKKSRPVRLEPDSIGIFGIVLVRAVHKANSAKLVYQHQDLIRYLKDDHICISIYLVNHIDLLLMEGNPFVKGGERVRGLVKITSENVTGEFQSVCPNKNNVLIRKIFSSVTPRSINTGEGTRCSATLRSSSIKALAMVEQ